MIDISKMSDERKSQHLCSVADIPKIRNLGMGSDGPEWEFTTPGLYEVDDDGNPVHMPLAWKVLNWASEQDAAIDDYSYPYIFSQGVEELFDTTEEIKDQIWAKPPAKAIRVLLDTVLELIVKAEMVEEE